MSDHEPFDWDDVRIFLATFRAGSLRQAANDLGVSRPTASRHLIALEERLRLKLFERRPPAVVCDGHVDLTVDLLHRDIDLRRP